MIKTCFEFYNVMPSLINTRKVFQTPSLRLAIAPDAGGTLRKHFHELASRTLHTRRSNFLLDWDAFAQMMDGLDPDWLVWGIRVSDGKIHFLLLDLQRDFVAGTSSCDAEYVIDLAKWYSLAGLDKFKLEFSVCPNLPPCYTIEVTNYDGALVTDFIN